VAAKLGIATEYLSVALCPLDIPSNTPFASPACAPPARRSEPTPAQPFRGTSDNLGMRPCKITRPLVIPSLSEQDGAVLLDHDQRGFAP
jgi:hypothetical protein